MAKHIMLYHKTEHVEDLKEARADDGKWITTASGVKIKIHHVVDDVEAEDKREDVVHGVVAEDSGVWEDESDGEADLNDHICPECGFSFSTVENLGTHLQNVHAKMDQSATAIATSTGKVLKPSGPAPSHIVNMSFKFKCDNCPYSSNSKENVNDHTRRVHNALKCDKCNYSTMSHANLMVHKRVSHAGIPLKNSHSKINQGARATTSKEISSSKENANDRSRTVHDGIDRLRCDKCNYSTKSRANFIEHRMVHAGAGVRNLRIPLKNAQTNRGARVTTTKETSNSKANEDNHMRTVNEIIGRFNCDKCNYSSRSHANLNIHMRTAHDRVRIPSNNFHSKTTHGARMSTPKEIKSACSFIESLGTPVAPNSAFNYKCDKCDYSTKRKFNLSLHIRRVHDGRKNFKCTMCTYSSFDKSNLNKHLVNVHVKKIKGISVSVVEPPNEKPESKPYPEKTRINIRKMIMGDPITWVSGSDGYNQDGQNICLKLNSRDHEDIEDFAKKHYGVVDKIIQELNTPLRYVSQKSQEIVASEEPKVISYRPLSSYCAEALSSYCAEGDTSTTDSLESSPSMTCHYLDQGLNASSPSPTPLQMDIEEPTLQMDIEEALRRMTQIKSLEKGFTDDIKSTGDQDFSKITDSVTEGMRTGKASQSGGDNTQPPPCPICKKFYPHHKKREHFASSHYQTELRRFTTTSGGVTTCNICGKKGNNRAMAARHCGLQHNKLMEVVSPKHIDYIHRMKPGRKSAISVPHATNPTESTRDGSMSPPATMIFI